MKMASSQNDTPNDQPVSENIRNQTDRYEDETNLIDCFRVLWKRKYFIVLGSGLPALLVGLILFLSPTKHKLTFLYDTGLTQKTYKSLLDKFYSAENLDKLIAKLKEGKIDGCSHGMLAANVQFEVLSPYLQTNAAKTTDAENPHEIQQARGTLLAVTVMGESHKDMEKISSIIRDNFEKVLPIYDAQQELNIAIINLRTKMADIEEKKFSLELELEKERAILTKLENLEPAGSSQIPSGIIVQFDSVDQNRKYLPLAYQIQANISNIIDLEESIRTDQEKYNYYEDLQSLNKRLFDEIMSKTSSYYTIEEFHSSLTDIADNYEGKKLIDYLNAYIKRIENVISTNTPVVERPSVNLVPKGIVKKSTIVFAALLIITTFAAFFLEAVPKNGNPAL